MLTKTCPICGTKLSLKTETKVFTAKYAGSEHSVNLPVTVCSYCGAKFDTNNKDDELRKEAMITARNKSVSTTLSNLEKELSFTDIERSFSLPPKTLSKWKNMSKAPSAAASALVSLLGVFPWLAYIGITNYEPLTAYKIAGAAFFNKATYDEKVKAFYTSNENHEILGLINDKTISTQSYEVQPIPIPNNNYSEKISSETIKMEV